MEPRGADEQESRERLSVPLRAYGYDFRCMGRTSNAAPSPHRTSAFLMTASRAPHASGLDALSEARGNECTVLRRGE